MGWVAKSHFTIEDSTGQWSDEANYKDDNTSTYATWTANAEPGPLTVVSDILIYTNKLRIKAYRVTFPLQDSFVINLYVSPGEWITVHNGILGTTGLATITYDPCIMLQMELIAGQIQYDQKAFEFDIYQMASRPLVNGSLALGKKGLV